MGTKRISYIAFFIALGIVLPLAFHMFGTGLGRIFLPMHLPVLLAGVLMGPAAGAIVGVMTPIFSSLLTGMPPVFPMLPIMFIELLVYGLAIGYLYNIRKSNILLSLFVSMLLGRISAATVVMVLVYLFNISNLPGNPLLYIWGTIATGFPGIIIQLLLIPLLAKNLVVFFQKNKNKQDFDT